MSQILSAGTVAPDFKLRVTPDQWLSLGDLKGKPVILAFYPADWSPGSFITERSNSMISSPPSNCGSPPGRPCNLNPGRTRQPETGH